MLHAATWTPTVDKHARSFVGSSQAEWLRNHSTAKSTDFTLLPDNGREILRQVLADSTIPERAVLDLLQASSFCFPTSSLVSRNHGGKWCTKCKLCKRAVDTYAHSFMQCPELHGAGHTMHDTIAKALIERIADTLRLQGSLPLLVETHIGERVDAIWPDCPVALGDFVPDGIIISYSHPPSKFPSRVVIVEFARCYTIELTELELIGAAKRNQYHQLSLYLQARYSNHEVNCLSFILSLAAFSGSTPGHRKSGSQTVKLSGLLLPKPPSSRWLVFELVS
eukprot:1492974-Rhodomonas_salina.1